MDNPEPWMVEFVSWLARNEVRVYKKNGRMYVRGNKNMNDADKKMLAEFEQMVLARNN